MDLDLFQEILKQAEEVGVIQVELTGGEPFLHPKVESFFENAYLFGMSVTVTSNGIFIPIKKVLKYMLDCKFDVLRVSIHGAKPDTHDKLVGYNGAFGKAFRNILEFKKLGVKVYIVFLVNKYSDREIDEAYKFWKEFDIEVGFGLDIIGQGMEELYLTEDELKEVVEIISCISSESYESSKSCSAMVFSLHVTTEGFLTPCIKIPVPLGSLRSVSLKEILSSEKFSDFQENFVRYLSNTMEHGEFYCPGSNYLYTRNMFQHHFYNRLLNKVHNQLFGGK